MPKIFFAFSYLSRNTPLASVPRFLVRNTVRGVSVLTLGVIALFSPHFAFADYQVFSINPIPANTPVASPSYTMTGVGAGSIGVFEYTGDATVTQFDRVTLPFCRYGGSNTGDIYLEVRSSTTTGPIVASSTLAVNSGNIWSTGCNSTYINATTSTFVLNENVQWLSGVKMYFIFRPVSTTATFMFSFRSTVGYDTTLNGIYGELGSFPILYAGAYRLYTSSDGYALGIQPQEYNASSSVVVCTSWDLGCYFLQGLVNAFVPSDASIDRIKNLTLASSSPFGYGYELPNVISNLSSATTVPYSLTIDLTSIQTVFRTIDPGISIATTSVEVFNACWVDSKTGSLYSTYIMPLLTAAYFFLALGILYLLAHSFFK